MKRDVIGLYMGIVKNVFVLVNDKKTTKAVLLNYSTAAMEIVSLTFSTILMVYKIVTHIRDLKFSKIPHEIVVYLKVSFYRIKFMSFILLMSPLLYVAPAKIISNETDLIVEFLSLGKTVDELAKRYGSSVSMDEFESDANDILNGKQK